MPWHVQVGALQLKNNTSLLAEAQGVYLVNLLLALQYLQPSLLGGELFPSEGVAEAEGDQAGEEDPGPELRELIVACQSSLMLNESRKFMTVEGRSWAGVFG